MADLTLEGTRGEDIVQFSVFTANRLGRAHDLIRLFSRNEVHVLAMTVLDTTDSAILRLIVDDPARARALLNEHNFHFTETRVLVVELGAADKLLGALSALLEAEINIHYLYSFLVRPKGSGGCRGRPAPAPVSRADAKGHHPVNLPMLNLDRRMPSSTKPAFAQGFAVIDCSLNRPGQRPSNALTL
jgi:hypothetical protein